MDKNSPEPVRWLSWGRSIEPSDITKRLMIFVLFITPILSYLCVVSVFSYGGSLSQTISTLTFSGIWNTMVSNFSWNVLMVVVGWIVFQLVLSMLPDVLHTIPILRRLYVGGVRKGQTTPAGISLWYKINGLQAWLITHVLFYLLCFQWGIVDPAVIAENWLGLFVVCNILGFALSIVAYIKAHLNSSYPEDDKFSGSWIYDYIMGIEFNPRIYNIDFKLFFNGRPGIIAWTLINLSFTAKQFKTYGYITDSMVLVNILQGLYVLDFFWNENWYLRTIDIAHDHFGWTLSWGDCVWLPFMYTLQAGYLAVNPVVLGGNTSILLGIIGFSGYILFRLTNYQKDKFRSLSCREKLKSYRYLECMYTTKDGMQHNSKLLLSGLWGWARHMNYTGDIILSTVYCVACGFQHLLPYFYCIYMTILLIVRCSRDEERCFSKYGCRWEQYCSLVTHRLIPYVY